MAAYTVEPGTGDRGDGFVVRGPDGVMVGPVWIDQSDAEVEATTLNRAYQWGVLHARNEVEQGTRDYYASRIAGALLANWDRTFEDDRPPAEVAARIFELADALLAARSAAAAG